MLRPIDTSDELLEKKSASKSLFYYSTLSFAVRPRRLLAIELIAVQMVY